MKIMRGFAALDHGDGMQSAGIPGLVHARRPWYRAAVLFSAIVMASLSLALVPGAARATTGPSLAWSTKALVEQAPFATRFPLEVVACPTITLCVASDDRGNVLTSTAPTGGPASWTSKSLHQEYDARNPVACAGTSFCVVSFGDNVMYVSTDPTSASPDWRQTATPAIGVVSAISCPSTHLCVALAGSQIATSTDPTATKPTWRVTPPNRPDPAITGIACPTSSFCAAVDSDGNILTSTSPAGGAADWRLANIDGSDSLSGVTCPTTTFCAALDSVGRVLYSTNPMDSAAWHVTTAPQAGGLDCRSASFCSAFDSQGNVFTTSDPSGGSAAWQTSPADGGGVPGAPNLNDMSCPSAQLCVIADARGDVLASTTPAGGASAWTDTPVGGITAITGLDCPTRSMCVGGDQEGHILASADPTGGSAAWKLSRVDSPSNTVGGVSCPDASLCVAVDSIGDLLTSTDPAGGAASWTKLSITGVPIGAVTCRSSSFCVAVGDSGKVLTSADPVGGASAWTSTGATLMPNVVAISCPSTSLCVAAGDGDQTHGSGTGSGWLAASVDPAGGSPWTSSFSMASVYFASISCPSTSLCVAAASTGGTGAGEKPDFLLSSTDPAGGSAAWKQDNIQIDSSLSSVSCPSSSFCVAAGQDGIYTSTAPSGGPSAWTRSALAATSAVSCPTTSLCVAASSDGDIFVGTPPTRTTTALRLSHANITYGHERSERLSVLVRSRHGVPAGRIVITQGSKTICRLKLKGGKADCTLSSKQLKRGAYKLRAYFQGSNGFLASASRTERLKVLR